MTGTRGFTITCNVCNSTQVQLWDRYRKGEDCPEKVLRCADCKQEVAY